MQTSGISGEGPVNDEHAARVRPSAADLRTNEALKHLTDLLESTRASSVHMTYFERDRELEALRRFSEQRARRARINTIVISVSVVAASALAGALILLFINSAAVEGEQWTSLIATASGGIAVFAAASTVRSLLRAARADRRAELETTIARLNSELQSALAQLERVSREAEMNSRDRRTTDHPLKNEGESLVD